MAVETGHRRSIRLRGYDYTRHGEYFVTVCTEERRRLFGTVVGGRMALNDAGRLLVITPFPATETRFSAPRAAWCNQYVLHAADSVVIGQLAPDGMLACLLADLPNDKPLTVLNRMVHLSDEETVKA